MQKTTDASFHGHEMSIKAGSQSRLAAAQGWPCGRLKQASRRPSGVDGDVLSLHGGDGRTMPHID